MMRFFCPVPKVLTESEQQKIFDSAIRILSEVYLTSEGTDEFNQALTDFGCQVGKKKVRFPKPVIKKLLGRIEESKVKQAKDAHEELPEKITPCVSGQGGLVTDTRDDKIRKATTDDLAYLSRFMDSLGSEVGWCHPTFIPADKPLRTREIHAFATICMNHSKPICVSPYSPQAVKYMAEILRVCLGSMEKVITNHNLIRHSLWINTPFMISKDVLEGAMASRKLFGHKLSITIMPIAGASTAITAPGCLALVTAEVLAANIISLALDDDLVGYCSSPLSMDMKVGAHVEQDPYTDLLRVGANQMRVFIFGGQPDFGAFAPRTAAKIPGAQAMMEKSIGGFWHMLCGGRCFNSVGTLSYCDTASFVQILLDLELTEYLNRILRGLNCDGEDRLAEKINLEVMPQGARFMEQEHTLNYFREEQWYPRFLDRRGANAWINDPKTMVDNARQEAIRILETSQNKSPLTSQQKNEIGLILKQADHELG